MASLQLIAQRASGTPVQMVPSQHRDCVMGSSAGIVLSIISMLLRLQTCGQACCTKMKRQIFTWSAL